MKFEKVSLTVFPSAENPVEMFVDVSLEISAWGILIRAAGKTTILPYHSFIKAEIQESDFIPVRLPSQVYIKEIKRDLDS